MKRIGRIIDMLITSGRSGDVSINSEGLLEHLANSNYKPKHWWEIRYQKGLRFCLVLSAVVVMITVILYYGIRCINDVILYENQLTINEQGAFYPRKSLNCEYALYLFNTADLWANSGILVNKKDRIRLNVSGGYNSWTEGVIVASQYNKELRYKWVSYDTIIADTAGTKKCISRGKMGGFGCALYAIAPESQSLKSNPLLCMPEKQHKWWQFSTENSDWNGSMFIWTTDKSNRFHKAGRTGTLFFAVNDLYLKDNKEIEDYYNKHKDAHGKPYSEEQIKNRKKCPKHEFPEYEDNLGQLLVSVEIQRHVPYGLFRPMMVYRWLEYKVFETLDIYNDSLLGNIISLVWLLLFTIWIAFLFALYIITLWAIVYLLFWGGYRLTHNRNY